MDHRKSKLNTLNWQILKLPSREENESNTQESFEEVKKELIALASIINPPLTEKDELLLAA